MLIKASLQPNDTASAFSLRVFHTRHSCHDKIINNNDELSPDCLMYKIQGKYDS